jgi:hypothetical protein
MLPVESERTRSAALEAMAWVVSTMIGSCWQIASRKAADVVAKKSSSRLRVYLPSLSHSPNPDSDRLPSSKRIKIHDLTGSCHNPSRELLLVSSRMRFSVTGCLSCILGSVVVGAKTLASHFGRSNVLRGFLPSLPSHSPTPSPKICPHNYLVSRRIHLLYYYSTLDKKKSYHNCFGRFP